MPIGPEVAGTTGARIKQTHANANLLIFGLLILVAHAAGVNDTVTAIACVAYFWARVVQIVVPGLGNPLVRTLIFVAGFGCQLALAWQILM